MVDIRRRKERRGTGTAWSTANEILGQGEIGWVRDDPNYFKFGNGSTPWNSLLNRYEPTLAGLVNLYSASQLSNALTQLSSSGLLSVPRGALVVPGDHSIPTSTVWQGKGAHPDGTTGSVWQLDTNGVPVFKITGGQRFTHMQDMVIDCMNKTGATGVKLVKGAGAEAEASFHLSWHRTAFKNGVYGVDIVDPAFGWQVTGVTFMDCWFTNQSEACFRSNTVNQRANFIGCSFSPSTNGVADCIDLIRSATTLVMNCTFNGSNNIDPKSFDWTFTSGNVNTTTNKVNKSGTLSQTGDPVYVITSGTLPGKLTLIQRYFIRKVGEDHSFHWTSKDAQYDLNAVPLPTAGTGTQTVLCASRLIHTGRPRACVATEGHNGPLTIINCEAESLVYFLAVNGNNETQYPITLINNLTQCAMKYDSNCEIISIANNYGARSHLDNIGVRAHVRSIGDKVWTLDGLGASYTDVAGHPVPYPHHFSNFAGDSVIDVERELSFIPSDLDETICMIESDTYNQADASNVTANWYDQSKRKGTVTITGTPTFELNELAGKPIIRLGADSNDTINLHDISGYLWYKVFLLMKVTTVNGAGNTLGTDVTLIDNYPWTDDKVYSGVATDVRKAGVLPTINLLNAWTLAEWCSGPGYYSYIQNGVTQQELSSNNPSWPAAAKIGYNGLTYMKADLASFIVCVGTRKLEIPKVRSIRDYIKDKWGVG